ncbi:hypothetical protein [Neorhizobium galegae]|uniref:hypothetical protein n=1 Tax=Neorhizobium galegae TaxID=399 RepID=UPI00127DACBF|nr:hypothetical protein [Neorhizobium galegae]KAA9386833.1 hypothetical protein F4V88_10290 [Neorhizobium galegae]MCM2501967.1 hypothetical protein [Neorhizobium galegae]MCQ1774771.1 hypothetical protein [Neorhizobium galegae]MCQ1799693.1 hypothetical protein [Neorhizobium galegae]
MSTLKYYTDAEDMLYDIAATDFADRGTINAVDEETIVSMSRDFARSAHEIARALMLDRVQVERVLDRASSRTPERAYSSALSPM